MVKGGKKKASPKKNLLYRDTLKSPWKERYLQKIAFIDGRDPLDVADLKTWVRNAEDLLPSVSCFDIVNYLVFSTSTYTQEELKCYKGLEAYNQFVCGWVSDRAVYVCNDGKHVAVSAKVLHSQRLREKPLRPWVVCDADGVVTASHCNCMAGLGELCTHVSALLFSIQAVVQIRDSETVTQRPAYWKLPPEMKHLEYTPIWQMDLTSAKALHRKLNDSLACDESPSEPVDPLPTEKESPSKSDSLSPTQDDLDAFYQGLFATGTKPALLSTMAEYSDAYVPEVESQKYPALLGNMFDSTLLEASHTELVSRSEDFCDKLNVNRDQAQCVEEATRKQSKTKAWYRFRTGRVTASKAKAVCRTRIEAPSRSLIKTICYPEATQFTSKATRWGCKHEEQALKAFEREMTPYHDDLAVNECGFFIDTDHPYIGASPDGTVSCKCCGTSLIEIKCPYCVRENSLSEKTPECLERTSNGRLQLNRDHAYYYQVQTQLGVTGISSSYFVVWTEKDIHIERLRFDQEIFDDICQKSKAFFISAILPEMLGKFYTRSALPATGGSSCAGTGNDNTIVLVIIDTNVTSQTDATTIATTCNKAAVTVTNTAVTGHPCTTQTGTSLNNTAITSHTATPTGPAVNNAGVDDRTAVLTVTALTNTPLTSHTTPWTDTAVTTSTPVGCTATPKKARVNARKDTRHKTSTHTIARLTTNTKVTECTADTSTTIWCHCRKEQYGRMIGCDDDNCEYEWFHYPCVGIRKKPKGDWYCRDCTQRREADKENIK